MEKDEEGNDDVLEAVDTEDSIQNWEDKMNWKMLLD